MNYVFITMLFCLLLILCAIFFSIGFYSGLNRNLKVKRKRQTVQPCKEQEQINFKKIQEEKNFWNYNGYDQE